MTALRAEPSFGREEERAERAGGSPADPPRFRTERGKKWKSDPRDSCRTYFLAGAFFSSTNLMPNFPLLSMKKTHSDAASHAVECLPFAGWNRYEPGPSLASGFPSSPWIQVPEMITIL